MPILIVSAVMLGVCAVLWRLLPPDDGSGPRFPDRLTEADLVPIPVERSDPKRQAPRRIR
jgi:hypothetical protein